jgi:hypothetical protein
MAVPTHMRRMVYREKRRERRGQEINEKKEKEVEKSCYRFILINLCCAIKIK